jgi:hypothetical protein
MSAALISAAQNPELVKSATDMVKTTQSNAMKVLKVVGIALGAGLATFAIVKIVKKAKEAKKANDDLSKNTKDINDTNVHIDEATLNNMANALYTAFNQDALIFSTYKDKDIVNILARLTNKDEWKALCQAFGTRAATKDDGGKPHDLAWFLGANNASHKADFQKELDRIGLPGILGRLR